MKKIFESDWFEDFIEAFLFALIAVLAADEVGLGKFALILLLAWLVTIGFTYFRKKRDFENKK